MEFGKIFLGLIGLCLLSEYSDALPALAQTSITMTENYVDPGTRLVGLVDVIGTPVDVTISSQPNAGQFAVGLSANKGGLFFYLTAGFILDYETASSLAVVVVEVKDVQFLPEKLSLKSAKELFEYYQKVEQDYRHLISGTIQGGNHAEMTQQIKSVITCVQERPVWIPSSMIR